MRTDARRWTRDAVLAAFAVAFLLTFPYLLAARSSTFSLFGVTRDVDQSFYAARMTGGYAPETMRLALTDAAGFGFLKVLYAATGSPEASWVLARALLAFAWTLLLYLVIVTPTGAPRASLVAACAIVLFGDAAFAFTRWGQPPFTGFVDALRGLSMTSGPYNLYLGPFRLLSPGFSVAALLFAGWLVVEFPSPLVAGLATGALAYVHADVWTIGLCALVGFRHWKALGVALLVSVPWIAVLARLDPDFLLRTKAVWSHAPEFSGLMFLAAAASAFRYHRWLGGALVGVALGLNTQVVTGLSIQPFHWELVGLFLAATAIAIEVALLSKEEVGWTLALGVLFVVGLARGVAWTHTEASTLAMRPESREALAWVGGTGAGKSVAAVGPDAALTLPVYARARTLAVCDSPVAADVPVFENAVRLAYSARLLGADRERFLSLLSSPGSVQDDAAYGPGEEWRVTVGAEKALFPYVYFNEYPRERLAKLLEDAWEEAGQRRYSVDYLWFGPFERELLATASGLGTPEFSNGWYSIFKADSGALLSRK